MMNAVELKVKLKVELFNDVAPEAADGKKEKGRGSELRWIS